MLKPFVASALILFSIEQPSATERPSLREADRIRLAEAFGLADQVQDDLWPGWSEVPFVVLLVTADHEFLLRHPSPTPEFEKLGHDPLLQCTVYARERVFSPNLLATFPAVGGVPTVVIGQPEQTDRSSTFWVVMALHEHFHQLQYSQPDYYEAAGALDLEGDDPTGQWMLDYPFDYDDEAIGREIAGLARVLVHALRATDAPELPQRLAELRQARARLRAACEEKDYRYLSFQLWQEGVSRFTEIRVAEAAAREHRPLPEFEALGDFTPYGEVAERLRGDLIRELEELSLAQMKRVAFYPVGAAEAMILDAASPGWRRRYFTEKFELERHHIRPPGP
jgi:hypothetical protein